ncbi:MAG: guanylate kinase [Deltaproteobacteria bacterium]|nr:guanylate kinase [Deltaproteobacteria bacterium]
MKGRVFVISGPSGAGKSTLIKGVRERITDIGYSVSHTTRRPRDGEIEGRDYFFIDKEEFREMINSNAFVEWARVYDDFYGTSYGALTDKLNAGQDVILDIDIQGAKNIKEKITDCMLIFILPPSREVLEQRLRERATDSTDALVKRIALAAKELKNCCWYDYLIINDDLEKATKALEAVILADRCSKTRILSDVETRLSL